MHWLNLPNALTLLRLVGSFFFLYYGLHEAWYFSWLIFSIAAATDMVDGALARFLMQRTRLGGFLDPAADKLLMFFGFLVLTLKGAIPLWITSVVVLRDLMITVGIFFLFCRHASFAYRPTYLSKIATFLQIVTLFATLFNLAQVSLYYVSPQGLFTLTLTTTLVTAVTGIQYVRIGLRILQGHQGETKGSLPLEGGG